MALFKVASFLATWEEEEESGLSGFKTKGSTH